MRIVNEERSRVDYSYFIFISGFCMTLFKSTTIPVILYYQTINDLTKQLYLCLHYWCKSAPLSITHVIGRLGSVSPSPHQIGVHATEAA